MKKIIVKEVDRLHGKKNKNKIISEYLIYLKIDDVNIKCYNEFGHNAKNDRVKNILFTEFSTSLYENEVNDLIEEITVF